MPNVPFHDWRRLAPHRPLAPGDTAYVPRPAHGGDAIAAWVTAGGGAILVSGPTGVGKSTELARAADSLKAERVTLLIQVDRLANVHRLTGADLMLLIAVQLVKHTPEQLGMSISHDLHAAVEAAVGHFPIPSSTRPLRTAGAHIVRRAILEVARLSGRGLCLVIDGLDKLSPAATPQIFASLANLPDEAALVTTIPCHAALSGGTKTIVRSGEHLHRIAALDVQGAAGVEAGRFLTSVVARRLVGGDAPPRELESLLEIALHQSGGLPRVFLQLVADAGTYACIARGERWPVLSDLQQAIRDQEDSFRWALLLGDTIAINRIAGSEGRELDLERRVRLLAQGILLERERDGILSLEAHPLVLAALQKCPNTNLTQA